MAGPPGRAGGPSPPPPASPSGASVPGPSTGLPIEEFEALSRFAPAEVHDAFSQKGFRRSLFDHAQRNPAHIAKVRWSLNGKPVRSLAAVLADPTPVEKLVVVFHEPKQDPSAWEFTTPTALVTTDAQGSGRVLTFRYDPHALSPWDPHDPGHDETCVVRFSVREGYVPRSLKQEQETNEGRPPPPLPFELFSLAEFRKFVRTTGAVPFRVAIHLYTRRTRLRYDIDLIHNYLLADPRAGRFSIEDRVERSARICHGLDRFVARGTLPLLPRRVLELLFDSKGLSVPDVAVILTVSPELAKAALESLVGRQFAALDPRTQNFLPLPQVFLTKAEAEREQREEVESKKPGAQPREVRESVQELLRDLESKAVCPLCGTATAASGELLCEDCTAAVEQEAEGEGPSPSEELPSDDDGDDEMG